MFHLVSRHSVLHFCLPCRAHHRSNLPSVQFQARRHRINQHLVEHRAIFLVKFLQHLLHQVYNHRRNHLLNRVRRLQASRLHILPCRMYQHSIQQIDPRVGQRCLQHEDQQDNQQPSQRVDLQTNQLALRHHSVYVYIGRMGICGKKVRSRCGFVWRALIAMLMILKTIVV